jgi:hypothetical protein
VNARPQQRPGDTVTSYTWTQPPGTCFKTYNPNIQPPANNQLAPLASTDLSGTDTSGKGISVSPLAFYDSAAESLTLSCAVTVTAPDNKTTLNVTATSPSITMEKPTAYWTTNPNDPNSGPSYNLTPTGYIGYIEQWDANITVPSPFSGGSGCFAQIANPTIDFQRTPTGSQPINCYLKELQTNADGSTSWVLPQTGLDTMFPYPIGPSTNPQSSSAYQNYSTGYMWDVSTPGKSADTPLVGFGIAASDDGGNNWYDAFAGGSFTTWLMYKPNGGVWVPLQNVYWSWTGHVVKDKATGMWNSATSGTQPVTGNTANQGTQTNTPPQWTTVNVGASVLRP